MSSRNFENDVDRYAEVIKDLLFIANARIDVKAATNRLKKNLYIHELSNNPCCHPKDSAYAIKKLMTDDLIGELNIDGINEQKVRDRIKYPHRNTKPYNTSIKYKNLVSFMKYHDPDNGAYLIGHLIGLVGSSTIMQGAINE